MKPKIFESAWKMNNFWSNNAFLIEDIKNVAKMQF